MIELDPERITEVSAFVAARLAMVAALVFLPPVTELTILWLTAVMTLEVALVTAFLNMGSKQGRGSSRVAMQGLRDKAVAGGSSEPCGGWEEPQLK